MISRVVFRRGGGSGGAIAIASRRRAETSARRTPAPASSSLLPSLLRHGLATVQQGGRGGVGDDADGYDGLGQRQQLAAAQASLSAQQQRPRGYSNRDFDSSSSNHQGAAYDGVGDHHPGASTTSRRAGHRPRRDRRSEEGRDGLRSPRGPGQRVGDRKAPHAEGTYTWDDPSKQYVALLGELKRAGNWIEAIRTYKKFSREPEFSRVMFNATISMLSRGPRWRFALSVLEEMRDAGHPPDAYTFNSAIQACVRGREERLAFSLYEEMPTVGIQPDVYTFNHLITLCGEAGRVEDAASVMEQMEAAGLRASSMTYNALIVGCGNAGQPERAVDLLQEMRQKGIQVTEGSYSAGIAACGKSGQWERALFLLDEMKEGGDNLEPNEYCYNAAICSCERSSKWEEAVSLLREMQSAELEVGAGTYAHVIKACTNAGEVAQAESLIEEMRAAGMHVKSKTFAMVAKSAERGHGRDRSRDRGQAPRSQSDSWPLSPPSATGTANPEGTPAVSPSEGGGGWAFAAPDEPGASSPSSDGSGTTQPGERLRSEADDRAVRAVAGEQQGEPFRARAAEAAGAAGAASSGRGAVTLRAFQRRVGEHVKGRRWEEIVLELDEAIADPRVKVSMRMYEGSIAGLSVGGRWVEAISVLEKLQEAGLTPTSKCVTAAIRACARGSPPRWGMAVSLLRGLKEPDVWAFVATLTALARGGQWKTSVSLLKEMRPAGVEPNLYCYNSALAAFRTADPPEWQKACELLAQMEDEGVPPNLVSYSTAIQACLAASEPSTAESLMSDMVKAGCPPAEELKTLVVDANS